MYKRNFKRFLCTTTALAAIVSMPVNKVWAATQALTGTGIWASAGTFGGINLGDASDAAAGNDINIASFALTVTNDQIANDGSGLDIFNLGAVTGTTGSLLIDTGNATDLTVNMVSVNISGTGSATITNASSTTQAVTATMGSFYTFGDLNIVNAATAAKAINVSVTGVLTAFQSSTLMAGNFAGASSSMLTASGSVNFIGGIAVTAGADIAATANLVLEGASNNGNITLTDGALGLASVVFNGASKQTVPGSIDGNVANSGALTVNNIKGVTFSGNIGAAQPLLAVNVTGDATFSGSVDAVTTVVNAGGVLTSNGSVSTALSFTGVGSANINGGLTGNVDFANNAATATIGDASIVTGNIDSTIGSSGILTFSGASTVSGTVGATNAIATVNAGAAATKSVSFSSDVAATALNINGLGEVVLNGNFTGAIDFGANDGVVTLVDAKAINGTVDAGVLNTGTLTFSGSHTIANTIGATNDLKVINAGATGKTVIFNAAANAATINVTGTGNVAFNALATGKLNFNADGLATVSAGWTGALDTSVANKGTVTFNTVAPVGVTTIGATQSLKKLLLSGVSLTTSGAVNAQTIIIGTNAINTTAAGFTLTKGQNLYLDINNSVGGNGRINLGGANALDLQTGSKITVSLNTGHTVALNDTITVIAGGAAPIATNAKVFSATPGWAFENVSGGNNFIIKAVASKASAAAESNLAAGYGALIAGNANVDIGNLNTAVDAALTFSAKNELRESALPTVDGGIVTNALNVNQQVSSIIDTRVDAVRSGIYTGVASGSYKQANSFWAQGYASTAMQDRREGIDGYSSDFAGIALGYDNSNIMEGGILGMAVNYGGAIVNSKNANATNSKISNYGLSLYSNMNYDNNIFIDAQAGFAYNNIDISRYNVGGAGGPTAAASTNSYQYSAQLGIGQDYNTTSGIIFTPSVFTSYTHLSTSGYTESGAGGLNMTIGDETFDSLNIGAVVKSSVVLISEGGSLVKPEVKVGYYYDAIGDQVQTVASFAGNPGVSFKTSTPNPARNVLNAGLGVTYTSIANWDLSGKYGFVFKENYQSHNGSVRVTTRF